MTTYSDFQSLAWHEERDACGVGFIADLYGRKTHKTLQQAITALCNLKHRGAVNADGLTGDGAGLLTQIPHKFFMRILAENGIKIERGSDLGVGVFFVPNKESERMYELVSEVIAASSLEPLLWRDVPVKQKTLGSHAKERLPIIRQVFIKRPDGLDDDAYERRLYLTRKRLEKRLREANLGRFYVPSFSSRTIVYKGLMLGEQIENFYPDLADPDFETAIALFHQRYSTNTMPRWSLAQPFRYLAHNGEINTLQGNVNFMRVREPVLSSKIWGPHVKELVPVIEEGGSDSAALDNAFELLMLSGRDPIHSIMMLVPEAFEDNESLDPEIRAFFEYHTALMEPWDGPAALALTDGRYAVAALDRNGLRPQRYWISKEGTIIVGSEAGMVPIPEEDIIEKGKLGPGQILAVDTKEQKLLKNAEIKKMYASKKPYRAWLEQHTIRPVEVKDELSQRLWDKEVLTRTQKAFGYSSEDYDRIFEAMSITGDIPVGSMGDDTPLAFLSEQPQQLYRYFKQRFAQVTNPPIDPLRERMVMSLETIIGPRGSILEEDEASAAVMRFHSPIVSETEFAWIKTQKHVSVVTVNATFKTAKGPEGFEQALERLCYEAEMAVRDGAGVVIISDRAVDQDTASLPMLLATAAVHNKLLEAGLRTKTAMVLETGEPREDHHYGCLIGYGAGLIHPYLALATARDVPSTLKDPQGLTPEKAVKNYIKGVEKGLLKVMSKMGIAAIASYRAAKIFEAVGIDQAVIDHYFTGTPNRIGGATLQTFAIDTLRFHAEAFGETPELIDRGLYRFRKAGEYHALNPLVFKALHKAVRNEDFAAYEEYAKLVDERPAAYIRDLLEYRKAPIPRDLEDVEPIEDIVKRFTTQAMSHGSVSRETHETLAIAMNRLGAKSNSGEGGEDEIRFKPYDKDHPELSHAAWYPKAGDWANSAIKQVASARFGVTPEYLVSAQELEIKMAQGAKPGEGGQIPGHKVNDEIARIRRSVPGVTLISPPPHHDIYSIEDLAQLIYDLKRVNQKARITVKLVATAGVGIIAAGVAKGYADSIQISGNDGGTGASPLSSIKHAGLPWEIGLAETQQALVENDLRGRVTLRVDGGMKTGRDVIVGALLGAESFGFGTAALVAAGCAMIRQCHLNTCPVGVATQREDLRKKYTGEPEHVMRFMYYVAQQVRMILAEMGFRKLDDIIGRVDLLGPKTVKLPKDSKMDLSSILRDPDESFTKARRSETLHNDRYEEEIALDETVWLDAFESIESKKPHHKDYAITNRERTVGARLSGEIARKHSSEGLPAGTIQLSFTGVAGQSFGAFNNRGMHLTLLGEAQDYVGKGMYGGEIIVKPSASVKAKAFDNVIIGNTVMYGATGGSLYASGLAGERLCVRNSGGKAVVEGCGDHGCEYMTGGVVLVLGKTGRNFAAGMSGGVAYVYDPEGVFATRYNPGMVSSERVNAGDDSIDEELIKALLERHYKLTDSVRAKEILDDWKNTLGYFWKVAPHPSVEDKTAREIDIHSYEVKALEALKQEASQVAVSFGD